MSTLSAHCEQQAYLHRMLPGVSRVTMGISLVIAFGITAQDAEAAVEHFLEKQEHLANFDAPSFDDSGACVHVLPCAEAC